MVVVQPQEFIGFVRGYYPNSDHSDVVAALVSGGLYRHPQPRRRRCSGPFSRPLGAHTVSINSVGLQSGSDRVSEECRGRLVTRSESQPWSTAGLAQ